MRGEKQVEAVLRIALKKALGEKLVELAPAGGQGNHLTFRARSAGCAYFVRVEDGPERDDYMEVETWLLGALPGLGVPVPRVFAADVTRGDLPFAWQALEQIDTPDLNTWHRQGELDLVTVARRIGADVARWQELRPEGFGLFNPGILRREGRLCGFHEDYPAYFFLNLDRHLHFLCQEEFLSAAEAEAILGACRRFHGLLELSQGCLVHKDLALWNILGQRHEPCAYIDWDDAISGDPMDDISLLGCFHNGDVIREALEGYGSIRPLPEDFGPRFWLHLLRNMVVKSVIRVGAGYFDRDDRFFLLEPGVSGSDFKKQTRNRLQRALYGLLEGAAPYSL